MANALARLFDVGGAGGSSATEARNSLRGPHHCSRSYERSTTANSSASTLEPSAAASGSTSA